MKTLSFIASALLASALPLAGHAQAEHFSPEEVARGRYLAAAGDCAACHTEPGPGHPVMAGGYAMGTPLGIIYSTNITPSPSAGIGNYTEAQFACAVREGIRADGSHLYPAMPYAAYAGVSDEDIHALYAYFMQGVTPADTHPPLTKLPFPFNVRGSVVGWNTLFLKNKRMTDDPQHDAQWNRGRYLTETLGHCADCHTPRGRFMQEVAGQSLAGAPLGPWYAPNITSDRTSGIGGWSVAELAQYLASGHIGKAQAAGPMAEVIAHSTSHLTPADLKAMATYLLTVPAVSDPLAKGASFTFGAPGTLEAGLRGAPASAPEGEKLYSGLCASCHGSTGAGTPDGVLPSLFHNSTVGAARPDMLVAVILHGVDREVGESHVLMPGFGQQSYVQSLTDEQVAAVATFVRKTFGPGDAVTAEQVATARKGGAASPFVAQVRAGLAGGVVILVAAGLLLFRRRRKPHASGAA